MTFQQIYDVICRIPEGRVATYGQIAKLLGFPHHARRIGYALAALAASDHHTVPWHRVVNAKGRISPRGMDGSDDLQRFLLEEENIVFDDEGGISLEQFQWQAE